MTLLPGPAGWLKAPHLNGREQVGWRRRKDAKAIAALVASGLFGGALTVASPWLDWITDRPVLKEILFGFGLAFLTATVLALTVDMAVKRGLTADAFEGALGYLLPPLLRDELSWFYQLGVVCTRWTLVLSFDELPGDLLRTRFTLTRHFENVTGGRFRFKRDSSYRIDNFGIDEWGYDERSEITNFYYTINDGDPCLGLPVQRDATGRTVSVWAKKKINSVGSDDKIVVVVEGHETKRHNDTFTVFVRTATKDPEITIATPPTGFRFAVTFATRDPEEPRRETPGLVFTHRGVLIPFQGIRVRWSKP